MRLIDADRLKIDFGFTWDDIAPTREEMFEIIDRQPTAEPKTARWVNVNEGKWNTVEVLKCTACGEIDNRMYRTDGFCPNCGAKMGGALQWEEPEINPCRGCEDYDGQGGCLSNGGCGAKMEVTDG